MVPLEQAHQPPVQGEATAPRLLTPLQDHFLTRLDRLVKLREEQIKNNPGDKQALRLLSRALYSAYMECVGEGVGDQAGALMEKPKSGSPS